MGRFGLALAVMALAFGAGSTALAQDKAAAPKPFDKDQIARGMKEAPKVVAGANIPCTVTNAAYAGQAGKANAYEVACKEGLGYVVIAGGADPLKVYDCLRILGNAGLQCRLPENANPKLGLGPILVSNGHPCTIKDARFIGGNATADFYEAACQEGPGYVLQTPPSGISTSVKVIPCEQELGNPTLGCTLTTKAQSIAAIAALAAKSGKTCQVSDARMIPAATPDGSAYYEVACGEKPGFVVQADSKGDYRAAVDCASAVNIAGGCTMTDPAKAMAQEAGNYTSRAKAGGFNCDVAKYRIVGTQSGAVRSDVVELACTNRPDGVIAVLPQGTGGHARFVDCARAQEFGDNVSCTLTSLTPIYTKYTQALAARGRTTCKVSGTRYLGHSPQNTDYIETACADGKPGWVLELDQNDNAKTLLSCGQAAQMGLSCKLPTNVTH